MPPEDLNQDLVGFKFDGADATIEVLRTNAANPQYVDVKITDHDTRRSFDSVRVASQVRQRKYQPVS